MRYGRRDTLLPVPVSLAGARHGNGDRAPGSPPAPSPELEFILRTLFDLRMDMEDLRREFEVYRARQHDEVPVGPGRGSFVIPSPGGYVPFAPAIQLGPPPAAFPELDAEPEREEGTVVFRPGKTMADMEREAISAALLHSRGNRRRAAEMLGIGERTLYRKLKEYDIEA